MLNLNTEQCLSHLVLQCNCLVIEMLSSLQLDLFTALSQLMVKFVNLKDISQESIRKKKKINQK